MAWFRIAAALALGALSVQAQSASPSMAVEPSPDSAEERQSLRKLTICLAERRPRWARRTLEHAYLSDAQQFAASAALAGKDNCVVGPEAELTFRTSSLVGILAEHFLKSDMRGVDLARVAEGLETAASLNASEDFALCVAARNPAAARELVLSDLGSPAEAQAARQLAPHINPCFRAGEHQPVDLQALRALVATALYRGVRTVLAQGN